MKCKSLLVVLVAGLICLPLMSYGQNSPPGKLTVDRAWAEEIGGYRCSYALVTWENTTSKTFNQITIQAIAYNSAGQKINANERSFFAMVDGPIAPGFKRTLKIPVELGGENFSRMECSVIHP
jgi:hypothetical protein